MHQIDYKHLVYVLWFYQTNTGTSVEWIIIYFVRNIARDVHATTLKEYSAMMSDEI